MNNNHITATFNRIKAITWETDDSRLPSHYYLMLEYLRRSALWAQALNIAQKRPFIDFSAYIGKVPEIPELDILVKHLENCLIRYLVEQTCIRALLWSAVENSEEIKKYSLPAPYEPLIRMFERGGTFWTEHGFIMIDLLRITVRKREQYLTADPLFSLDDEYLDTLKLPSAKKS